ncbi:DUF1338-domain-containing protein [Thozetella sp. PMI_491]|nr:DUF1338-domain-containing protein [Thozetella sp. PMI_491]
MASTILGITEPPFGTGAKQQADFVHPDDLRTAFALAMSQMYKNEVPLYGDLIRIVQGVNRKAYEGRNNSDSLERLTLERHGAIRLGKPMELRTVRRIFAVLGMRPVGYYDLSAAGIPMHATCFRPTDVASLGRNPFRVFTTLLRPELIRSDEARMLALNLLSKRQIFSDELLRMLNVAEYQDGLHPEQAEVFIREALHTFSWAPVAASTSAEYQLLKAQHPILADVACFKTAHINHLTPRTLDITLAQSAMKQEGMTVKDRIEGPPVRKWPILLRQTSFLALEESIKFKGGSEVEMLVDGSHKARFGEIEERGAAVTPAGRRLYDSLLEEAMSTSRGQSPDIVDQILGQTFQKYPDTWDSLRQRDLVYCEYRCTGKSIPISMSYDNIKDPSIIDRLVDEGVLETLPITYEDFLPFSAAGIFQSNLQTGLPAEESLKASPDVGGMEVALDCSIIDSDSLYATAQSRSLASSLSELRSTMEGRASR